MYPAPVPLTVKPRKPTPQPWLPIIVVSHAERVAVSELTGEVCPYSELHRLFRSHPASIVIAPNAGDMLHDLDKQVLATWHAPLVSTWQFRVTPVKRERYHPDPTRRRIRVAELVVNYFGWSGQAKRKGHWHYPIDPGLFLAHTKLVDLIGEGPTVQRLLEWGQDVRQWCSANAIKVSPTVGGIAGQLLRDERFYPNPRRKVPWATNARARSVLPGNHYRLYVDEHTPVDATYIDMSAAHHHIAATTVFPLADTLYAQGDFKVDDDTMDSPWTTPWKAPGDPLFDTFLSWHGLFLLRLDVPTLAARQFPPPFMETPGRYRAWVFSNELPTVRALGAHIVGIDAAWVSPHADQGLNTFAQWALTETALTSDQRKRWLKPGLLAVYGNLAARSRISEYAYKVAGGKPTTYATGSKFIEAVAHVGDRAQEIPTVNVIHRGMIEAGTRCAVLTQARTLTDLGHTVLSIYADAIMVQAGPALPLLEPPWRVERHLTRLVFHSATAFQSVEVTKLPGIPHAARAELPTVRAARVLAAVNRPR